MLQNTDKTIVVVKLQAILQKKANSATIESVSTHYAITENRLKDLESEAARKSFCGKEGSYLEKYVLVDSLGQDGFSEEQVSLNDPRVVEFESLAKSAHQSA